MTSEKKALLRIRRGVSLGVEYPIHDGLNFIGRAGEQSVDIDLAPQEQHGSEAPNYTNWSGQWGSPDDPIRVYPQHALIICEKTGMFIEDLNSYCGTFVSRQRVYPGQKHPLKDNDVIQVGTVQLEVLVSETSKEASAL